jgi:hypothetical protein
MGRIGMQDRQEKQSGSAGQAVYTEDKNFREMFHHQEGQDLVQSQLLLKIICFSSYTFDNKISLIC